jgi:hypothetical protein
MLIKKVRLGDLLIQEHKITQQDLENAIKLQKTSPKYFNKRIGEILIEEGLVNEEIIMEVLSKQLNLPIAHKVEPDILLSKKIPPKLLERYKALPIKETQQYIEVAFADPLDIEAQNSINRYFTKPIKVIIAPEKEILKHVIQLKNREKAKNIIEQMKKEISGDATPTKDEESATMQFINFIISLSILSLIHI